MGKRHSAILPAYREEYGEPSARERDEKFPVLFEFLPYRKDDAFYIRDYPLYSLFRLGPVGPPSAVYLKGNFQRNNVFHLLLDQTFCFFHL